MQFKQFLIVLWASTLLGTILYLLFTEKIAAWGAGLVLVAAGIFLVMMVNADVLSSFAASWGQQAQIRMEMQQMTADVFAKVEYVKKLGEEMARFAAHSVATANRFVGEDHDEHMLNERERIRELMKSLGSESTRIADVLNEIDNTVASDLKHKVVRAVGGIHKLEQRAYEQLVEDLRERLRSYDRPDSHSNLVSFLKERKVYDESVEKALDRLDLFLREGHL